MSEKRIRSYEVKCLMELLSAVVNDDEIPKWNRQPGWGTVFKMADYHGIANMVYYALLALDEKKLEPWRPKFEERFHQAVLAEERYTSAILDIQGLLEARKIHCLVLQEFRMCSYYPQRDMRALKYIRLMVDKGKSNRVSEAMHDLDYEKRESRTDGEEWYYKIPGVSVVFQTELPFTNKKMKKYFSLPVKNYEKKNGHKYVHTFLPEEYYIHVISCSAESYARGSLDIRAMVDIWLYYINVYADLNWKHVNKELEYLGLKTFHLYMIQLAAYWFGGMLFPDNDSVFEAMEKYILSKGVQGRKISATLLPLVEEVADFYRKDLRRKRREQMMYWGFPRMDYMSTMFPSLNRAPWLLPVCWMIRLGRLGWQQTALFAGKKYAACSEAVRMWKDPKKDRINWKVWNFRSRIFALTEKICIKLRRKT